MMYYIRTGIEHVYRCLICQTYQLSIKKDFACAEYHGSTPAKIQRYLVEPYVMAADICGSNTHAGRGGWTLGGWTWYNGSVSWMYRLIIESVLGIQLKVNVLTFNPCVSNEWEHLSQQESELFEKLASLRSKK